MVLLNTQNLCFNWLIRNKSQYYIPKKSLTLPLPYKMLFFRKMQFSRHISIQWFHIKYYQNKKNIYEPQSVKTSLNDKVAKFELIVHT